MKNINKIHVLLVILSLITFTSCIKDKYDAIPQNIPHANLTANKTIAELKALYAGTLDSIEDDIIIKGIVISSDQAGNIYKSLYIQDSTAGIIISLDKTNLYTTLKPGQLVYVKCKGLYLGAYGGVVQLGFNYAGSIGRIPYAMIDSHIFPDGLPGSGIAPAIKTIPGLTGNDVCTKIQIDNVHFEKVGTEFASQLFSNTSLNLVDDNGNTIVLYNSKYADFASKLTPKGKGSIIAILSSYNSTYQLILNSYDDLINWDTTAQVMRDIINEPFTSTLGSFTTYSVQGAQEWTITSYGATMSGYNSGYYANIDWLISPSINLDNSTNEICTFTSAMNYGSANDGSLKFYYSTDYVSGDPTTAHWTEITGFSLSTGSWTWTPSGNIDLSSIQGTNVHLAFKYTSTTSSCATWELKNFKVTALSQGK
ncbi:MAG: DUF5017 domain-containing protein [Bacteroidales bacterium]|nr:DUF5017 domain-containing protein [Bacteroidales bacterium]